jgi:hypothetical protein
VAVRQLVSDFASYLYLPRLAGPDVLLQAIRAGVGMLTWAADTFAYAEGFDEEGGRYRGLYGGQIVSVYAESAGLVVKPELARRQLDAETGAAEAGGRGDGGGSGAGPTGPGESDPKTPVKELAAGPLPRRFHGTVELDPGRVGRDASRIAEEVIAHLVGQDGAEVTVTLEIEARLPGGATDHLVRTVTENSRELKFTSQGFESE